MRIKYADLGLTQFGNKEWESHSHGGIRNENRIYIYFCIPLIFLYFPNYPHSNHN